ncbi:aspartyl-phosphate phosphatase Spo0E family protein [Domibacillus sp. A3M-37]|uniref:aspartyl-phosphate phosphatase Spo0E family protein n=1 Tax=Domibacillus sp. A3M-37 TaxID=2962037 RepID=UPI0020B8FD4F|nr:aspartyl-phosphate phosphatase Spo0E family protein [Domibacillus sp. A3M-37]MCP3764072.1 aspartyl-phosphate phosphatase Spo0E family protein [Domibacillus sp. A3M-37]
MEQSQLNSTSLDSQINDLRFLMITAGQQHGLSSPETLRYSEELDKLILEFQLQYR